MNAAVFVQNNVATFPSSTLALYQTVIISERLELFFPCSYLIFSTNGSPQAVNMYNHSLF